MPKHWTQNEPRTKFALDIKVGDKVMYRYSWESHRAATVGWETITTDSLRVILYQFMAIEEYLIKPY